MYRCHVGLVEEGLLSSSPPHCGILCIGVAVAPDVVFTGRTEPAYGPRLVRKIRSAQPQKPQVLGQVNLLSKTNGDRIAVLWPVAQREQDQGAGLAEPSESFSPRLGLSIPLRRMT